jgi:subtilisin family serine protease
MRAAPVAVVVAVLAVSAPALLYAGPVLLPRASRSATPAAHLPGAIDVAGVRARLAARAAAIPVSDFVPGELIALPAPGHSLGTEASGRLAARDARLAEALSRNGLSEWRPIRAGSSRPGARFAAVTLMSRRADFDPYAAARELMATGAFRAVAPNLKLRLDATIPNDPDLDLQYGVFEPGDADVQLTDAWDVTRGDTTVLIGIIDTGVDLGHPDLASQIWTNPGEIPGNGVDDDGNGWIDDVHGYDFGNNDPDPNPHAVFDLATGIDVGFHGTFVAGVAAAATNNAEGIAGAGWGCRIVPLKAVDLNGDLTLEAITAAFQYAAANHIPIVNLSLGTTDPTAGPFFQVLVNDALAAGVMCVAAAGNDGTAKPSYPGACDSVLAVGATDDANQRASFSQFGPWVDVAAPGATIWSCICRNYEIDEFSQIFYLYLWYWDGERPYMLGDGTSFASPLAAGVAGLVRSRFPTFGPLQLIDHLRATGDVRVYDEPIGVKLNAFRAVSEGVAAVPAAIGSVALAAQARPNPSAGLTGLEFALARPSHVRVEVFDATGRLVRSLLDADRAAGPLQVTWNGADASGVRATAGVYFARIRTGEATRTVRLVRLD